CCSHRPSPCRSWQFRACRSVRRSWDSNTKMRRSQRSRDGSWTRWRPSLSLNCRLATKVRFLAPDHRRRSLSASASGPAIGNKFARIRIFRLLCAGFCLDRYQKGKHAKIATPHPKVRRHDERAICMGPLNGIRVIELAGLAPGPYCAMMLADMGADVLRIERPGGTRPGANDRLSLLNRSRRTVVIDLKSALGVAAVFRLLGNADALIEGFRPGVMERLGLGPDVCLKAYPRLVYGRMTGWGQHGPLAGAPGHDLNYIALSGVLHSIGHKGEPPTIPLNLVGDFACGGMLLAFGILCALIEAMRSGQGQVVDAAMVDGAASLMNFMHGMRAQGTWSDVRGDNSLDGAAPWYQVYETKDGQYVSIANVEKKFHDELLRLTGLDKESLPTQHDRKNWPTLRARFAEILRRQTSSL